MLEVVAVLLRSGERFPLCQRPEQKAHGLLWEFAGGKVEPGETKRQALARECREELGVEIAVGEEFLELTHVSGGDCPSDGFLRGASKRPAAGGWSTAPCGGSRRRRPDGSRCHRRMCRSCGRSKDCRTKISWERMV